MQQGRIALADNMVLILSESATFAFVEAERVCLRGQDIDLHGRGRCILRCDGINRTGDCRVLQVHRDEWIENFQFHLNRQFRLVKAILRKRIFAFEFQRRHRRKRPDRFGLQCANHRLAARTLRPHGKEAVGDPLFGKIAGNLPDRRFGLAVELDATRADTADDEIDGVKVIAFINTSRPRCGQPRIIQDGLLLAFSNGVALCLDACDDRASRFQLLFPSGGLEMFLNLGLGQAFGITGDLIQENVPRAPAFHRRCPKRHRGFFRPSSSPLERATDEAALVTIHIGSQVEVVPRDGEVIPTPHFDRLGRGEFDCRQDRLFFIAIHQC